MKKAKTVKKQDKDELRPHYDFNELGPGVRGKYFKRYWAGANMALLAPDVRAAFPTDEALNEALRALMNAKST